MRRTIQNQASPPAKQSPYFIQITAGTAAIAGLLFGFDTGVISGVILFIKREFGLTPFTEEFLVSAALIGAVCSSILSGRLRDSIERKRAILGTAFFFCTRVNSVRSSHEPRTINNGTQNARHSDRCGVLDCTAVHQRS